MKHARETIYKEHGGSGAPAAAGYPFSDQRRGPILGAVKTTLANLQCRTPAGADEEVASAFDNLREQLTALAVTIPPR